MAKEELVYIGIKGKVVALSRDTGEMKWTTNLTAGFLGGGGGFVHVVLDGDNLYATTQGEICCLDANTGELRWHNALKGYGVGVASIATRNNCSPVDLATQIIAEQQQQTSVSASTTGQ